VYFATHAVLVLRALRQALKELDAEGVEARWRRHASNAKIIREGVEERGFRLVADQGCRADTVSGIWTAEGAAPEIQKRLREKHKIDVARGLKENNSKMIRVGHLGNLTEKEARSFVRAFGDSVKGLGP
jgi:aspartate aminotransferase-like enzyme